MKTIQVTAPGQFAVIDVPIPEVGPGKILLRVTAVTTCPQWDLHLKHNEPMFIGHQFRYPYTTGQPGHEATGEVAAIGTGVNTVAVGDRVSTWRDPGHNQPGCYAQYVLLNAEDVIRVPDSLTPVATAPLELAACVAAVFLLLKAMDAIAGRQFGVNGLGPAGLIAVQMAKAEGAARIVGFDLAAKRRETAMNLGVDLVLDPRHVVEDQLPVRPRRPLIDTTIDCVGAKASVEFAMDRTRDVVALFGVQREDYTFAPRHWHSDGGGLRLCGYPGVSRASAEYAVQLIERGVLDLTPLSTHRLPLEEYMNGVELLERQEAIKICFFP
jgi:threonine dehydrogenase-like Zn-dependent dehydrogenase